MWSSPPVLQDPCEFGVSVGHVGPLGGRVQCYHHLAQGRQRRVDVHRLFGGSNIQKIETQRSDDIGTLTHQLAVHHHTGPSAHHITWTVHQRYHTRLPPLTSLSRTPCESDFFNRSDPARSTICNVPVMASPFSCRCTTVTETMVWEREETALSLVSCVARSLRPSEITSIT